MKRFFSILLVAILVVTSLATVAAAKEANPGDEVKLEITLTGEFANFLVSIKADPGLTITKIENVSASVKDSDTTARANWANAANTTEHTIYVTVKVADPIEPGKYYVSAVCERADKVIPVEEDTTDGIVDGLISTTVTIEGDVVVIPEPECEHVWDEGVETKAPTCTEDGVKTYTCTKCGETKTEVISATGHTPGETVIENEVEATCETAGSYDEVVYCSVCGEEISRETKTVSATGHKWDDGVVTKAPTCEDEGVKTYTCEHCGETKTEVIPALGHNYKDGVCTRCGEKDPNYVPPATEGEKDDVPKTGDISTPFYMTGALVLVMMAVACAFIFKRRTAK